MAVLGGAFRGPLIAINQPSAASQEQLSDWSVADIEISAEVHIQVFQPYSMGQAPNLVPFVHRCSNIGDDTRRPLP